MRWENESFYVQSITGYDGQVVYEERARRLHSAGFIRLRSSHVKGEDKGKYWEIWYLPGLWHLRGELKRTIEGLKSQAEKLDRVREWLFSFHVGEISMRAHHWGLSVD